MNEYLLANVRFYFAQSVFMNNCHHKAYSRLEKRKSLISNIVITFSAITIILLILQVIGLENDYESLINVSAFVGLVLTGASLVFELINKEDLSILMYQQKDTAEKYKTLRDKYMSLIEEIMSNTTDEEKLKIKRHKLLKKYSAIGEFSPNTSYEDYSGAQKALGLKGNTDEERENYKRELNHKLIDLMINKIPDESKYCVSYGQLKGCYWTIPATSTQGTTKEGDKDYIARVALSPNMDMDLHKKVFLDFVNGI